MKKVIKKRNNKLTQVYAWAVQYSIKKSKERKVLKAKKNA